MLISCEELRKLGIAHTAVALRRACKCSWSASRALNARTPQSHNGRIKLVEKRKNTTHVRAFLRKVRDIYDQFNDPIN